MQKNKAVRVVAVGSIGLDTIETPVARRVDVLGGSASYACAASAFYAPTGLVGVVGTDFPAACLRLYRKFGLDLAGLQTQEGKTFRWSGVYEKNMDNRRTISTELNVFADFSPELPESYRSAPFLLLGNISPQLQLHVLDQVEKPRFVMADTMDLWINVAREPLLAVIKRVHLLTLNESEARHLTGEQDLLAAARRLLKLGPRWIVIKRGENGSMLFSRKGLFILPAYPVEKVADPTGAGDTFAGGFIGALACGGAVNDAALRDAMICGSAAASFDVEAFSLDRLAKIGRRDLDRRVRQYRGMLTA